MDPQRTITIGGAGCSLLDRLYTPVDFQSPGFLRYCSKSKGDGGLFPGKLVFAEELEAFAGRPLPEIILDIAGGAGPASSNLGGPAIVALINAAQLLAGRGIAVRYYGAVGDDESGKLIRSIIERSPVDISRYRTVEGRSPCTYVFSDPSHHGGNGERTFVNDLAAAWKMGPEDLTEEFYANDILLFGATGLVPRLHDALTDLVQRAKARGRITVVSTVYDFRSEKANPHRRWALGASDETFRHTDLLITDREEALRLSGTADLEAACSFFKRRGVSAFVATCGPDPIRFFSDGRLFRRVEGEMETSAVVCERLRAGDRSGDTTGCGDNFVGGVLASLAAGLLRRGPGEIDLPSACALGIVSGGFACFYLGGTYLERTAGEKREAVSALYEAYREQAAHSFAIEPLEEPV